MPSLTLSGLASFASIIFSNLRVTPLSLVRHYVHQLCHVTGFDWSNKKGFRQAYRGYAKSQIATKPEAIGDGRFECQNVSFTAGKTAAEDDRIASSDLFFIEFVMRLLFLGR